MTFQFHRRETVMPGAAEACKAVKASSNQPCIRAFAALSSARASQIRATSHARGTIEKERGAKQDCRKVGKTCKEFGGSLSMCLRYFPFLTLSCMTAKTAECTGWRYRYFMNHSMIVAPGAIGCGVSRLGNQRTELNS